MVDDAECTQRESGASFSLPSRSPEFFSTRTPVSLSNRFTVFEDNGPGPQLHVLSEGTCSTESETESVACEPRIRRRRLSLVWDADSVSHPANGRGEVVPDSHDERLARVRQLMQEVRRGQHEESAATLVDPILSRRVVLVPQSGSPQSIVDRCKHKNHPQPTGPEFHPLRRASRERCPQESQQENPQNSRRRTLRLMWADSAQESHRDARNAECLVRDLAARIGPQVTGAPIPTAVRRQRWSP